MAVLNLQVNAGNDDNYQATNGNANQLTSTSLRLDTNNRVAALIFRSVSIAQGSTISNAILQLYGFSGSNLTINAEIYAEAADNPADLTSGSNNISARSLTTAHVTISTTLSSSGYTSSANISSVIQEIISRAGFVSGNKINIILSWNSGTTDISAYDQATTTKAAKLDITYSAGGGGISNKQYLGFF